MNKMNTKMLIAIMVHFQRLSCYPEFFLYTKQDPTRKINLNTKNCDNFIDINHNITIITHGYLASLDPNWMFEIKDILLDKREADVIVLNWRRESTTFSYHIAVKQMELTAQETRKLIIKCKIPHNNIYCIGQSLGAHLCGTISRKINFKRITGIDPSGTSIKDSRIRLNKSDAELVDVIHTDRCLGIYEPIGHINFYPNGGNKQPGCKTSPLMCKIVQKLRLGNDNTHKELSLKKLLKFTCSHIRSIDLYIESLYNPEAFKAVLCKNYNDFKMGICNFEVNTKVAYMGIDADRSISNGNFYLRTRSTSPFSAEF